METVRPEIVQGPSLQQMRLDKLTANGHRRRNARPAVCL